MRSFNVKSIVMSLCWLCHDVADFVVSNFMYIAFQIWFCKGITRKIWRKYSTLKAKYYLGLAARKPVFGVSDKVRFKPACSATETS